MQSIFSWARLILTMVFCTLASSAGAQFGGNFAVVSATGTGSGTLYSAIQQADAYGNGAAINFAYNLGIINVDQLPDITVGLTINGGSGNTLSGQNANRIFFINAPNQAVQINNLTLSNGLAHGGNGGVGGGAGGGGAGLGGAVFVNAGNVTFSSVAFTNNAATGGNGATAGAGGGGGGGGLGFGGGAGSNNADAGLLGAGGGGGARTTSGFAGSGQAAGQGGGLYGGGPGPSHSSNNNGFNATAPDGGGGGGGYDNLAYATSNGGNGGNANDFGGGGGGGSSVYDNGGSGGNGGFGGGGGGGADNDGAPAPYNSSQAGNGGNGGFGGGGGGGGGSPDEMFTGASFGGSAGYGGGKGGNGNEGAGGGGAALGAAVFVRSGASVSFTDSSTDAGSLTGGSGGNSGTGNNGGPGGAAGGALFLMGGNTTFTVSMGNTQTIAGSIAQSSTSSITKAGPGTLVLSATNSYTGGTIVTGGDLQLPNLALPGSTASVSSGAILEYNDSGTLAQPTFTYTGTGILRKTGAGKLIFGGQGNINVNFSAGALIDVQAGELVGTSSYQGIWANNQASLNIAGGATFDAVEGGPTGTLQIDALTGSGIFSGGYFSNSGGTSTVTLGVANGGGIFSGSLQDDISAHLSVVKTGGGVETFTGSNTYTGGTTISGGTLAIGASGGLPAGSAVVNNASFAVNATSTAGNVSGSGTTTIAAGDTLVANNFSQGALTMQVAGATAAANAKLKVTNVLSMGGTLTVNLVNSFLPVTGNSFDILDWGSRSGTFSTVNLPILGGRIVWDSSQLYNTGALSVVATYYAGDFNRDGHVNAADILIAEQALTDASGYQTAHGLTDPTLFNLVADVNGDGRFTNADLQDLLVILKNGGGSADPVPEPASWVLAFLTLAMVSGNRFSVRCVR